MVECTEDANHFDGGFKLLDYNDDNVDNKYNDRKVLKRVVGM